jgi:hypothetical protein
VRRYLVFTSLLGDVAGASCAVREAPLLRACCPCGFACASSLHAAAHIVRALSLTAPSFIPVCVCAVTAGIVGVIIYGLVNES